ncbi:enoyl-CoA hydratase/isomerase family protein [Mycolicibacterium sp. lyk4-40-TYG-92]|uniref:enoyl-CoA hydratase/isomerase family protein n=1 Tax=Mycolicibacterium sp. lyk4-40-TYG-92 TaxID=3040295 RepID=UPI00254B57F2|nr:enoyl-CoA hydratase/isomerase family protein [Mycolicibacterium sp. lyk4-40-TYG-92]
MSQFTQIKTSVADGVGTITFDRIDRRNALSLELMADMSDCLDEWRTNDDVACVVITGGDKVFCAGLDLQLQSGFTGETRVLYSDACMRAYGTLLDYAKPTIAAVSGPALGGGCDIAVFADIRIGSDDVIMGYPQIKMGLTPYFSPLWKIVGLSQAKLLTFSGDRIDAAEAARIGLLDRLVPAGQAVSAATELAKSIAETTTASAMNNKEMALRAPAMDPIAALTYETMAYREVIWHPEVNDRISKAYSKLRK